MKKKSTTRKRSTWRTIKKVALWLFIGHLIYLVACKWLNPPITITQMVDLAKGHGLKKDNIGYDAMGPNIKLAVMAAEDQLFPDHNGFDVKAIKKAQKHNEKHPNRVKGASTISQQTAKNVFLWQGRSYVRKGLEAYYTVLIELIWGKKRIMEVYLNSIEMGDGVYGAEAAAKHWYRKDAASLTRYEAAGIAAILPNPRKYKASNSSSYINRRKAKISREIGYVKLDY